MIVLDRLQISEQFLTMDIKPNNLVFSARACKFFVFAGRSRFKYTLTDVKGFPHIKFRTVEQHSVVV